MLFRLDQVGKQYSGRWIFEDVSSQCSESERIGLIGRNGIGKTTLLDLIEGRTQPDAGSVERSKNFSFSRVEQIPDFSDQKTLLLQTLSVFDGLKKQEQELEKLEEQIADGELSDAIATRYERLRRSFELAGGYDYRARTERVLFGLGFSSRDLDRACGQLSGGQRSRMALARALLKSATLLLLDEPTNHLDLEGVLWLAEYLRDSSRALVLISHDRDFLDRTTVKTWELEGGTLATYPGNFTASRRLRIERLRIKTQAYKRQQEWRKRTEEFVRRNIAGQKTRQAQSRRRQLTKTAWIKAPQLDETALQIPVPECPRGGSLVVEILDGSIGYEKLALIRNVNLRIGRGHRLGVLGGNGSGKTTLIKTILGQLPLMGGNVRWGHNFIPGYFQQEPFFENLQDSVYEFVGGLYPLWTDEAQRGLAARFGFRGDDVLKTIGQLSGGERSRLSLVDLFSRPFNVLVLDEPTNHLDIVSRESLEKTLADFEGAVVVVSHDLYFLKKTVDRFLLVRDGTVSEVESLSEVIGSHSRVSPSPPPKAAKSRVRETPESTISKYEKKRLEQRLADVEARVQELEAEQKELEKRLQASAHKHSEFRHLSQQYEDLEARLAALYQTWEELGSTLESVQ